MTATDSRAVREGPFLTTKEAAHFLKTNQFEEIDRRVGVFDADHAVQVFNQV